MSKNYKLVDQPQLCSVQEKTDWGRCILCLKVTSEALQCPAKSKCCDDGVGERYSTFTVNIVRFSELQQLSFQINPEHLDEGKGIGTTLLENSAK